MDTIANRIKTAMNIRNMKQSELVEITGIGKSSISTYISGAYEPKQKNIYKIAKALNVNEAWLMGNDVPMERNVIAISNTKTGKKTEFDLTKITNTLITAMDSVDEHNYHSVNSSTDSSNAKEYEFVKRMYEYIKLLNEDGLIEAEKRIEELTYIPKYNKTFDKSAKNDLNKEYLQSQAAHERTDIEVTEEMRKHDDDLMDDDSIWGK